MGRGGQSGGALTHVGPAGARLPVRVRVCPGRRQALAPLLAGRFRRALWAGKAKGAVMRVVTPSPSRAAASSPAPPASAFPTLIIGHTRFATSSLPSVRESHPHSWSPPRSVEAWSVQLSSSGAAKPVVRPASFSVAITHNGDFDYLRWSGQDHPHTDVSAWLARILGSPPPAHCDSSCVAGLMELFRTQGVWELALRRAFHEVVSPQFGEAFDFEPPGPDAPHAAPRRAAFLALSSIASACFASFVEASASASSASVAAAASASRAGGGAAPTLASFVAACPGGEPALATALAAAFAASPDDGSSTLLIRLHASPATCAAFASSAVAAFLHGDLYSSLSTFMALSKGSFGVAAVCSLDPGVLALASLNQPMAIGFEPATGVVLYASEASAVAVALAEPRRNTSSRDAHTAGATPRCGWRLDLDNVGGEVAEITFGAAREAGEVALPAAVVASSHIAPPPRHTAVAVDPSPDPAAAAAATGDEARMAAAVSASVHSPAPPPPPPLALPPPAPHPPPPPSPLQAALAKYDSLKGGSAAACVIAAAPPASPRARSAPSDDVPFALFPAPATATQTATASPRGAAVASHAGGAVAMASPPSSSASASASASAPAAVLLRLRGVQSSSPVAADAARSRLVRLGGAAAAHSRPSFDGASRNGSSSPAAVSAAAAAAAVPACRVSVASLVTDPAAEAEARERTARDAHNSRKPGGVEADLRDTARVLASLHAAWAGPRSPNAASADAFAAMLRAKADESSSSSSSASSGRLEVDVLVTGVETSLWVAEQFAADLQVLCPHLRVVALSANKLIGVLGNARGAISSPGFTYSRATMKLAPSKSVCLAISHSGQTFPTLHATSILQRACPGRVFVASGSFDTKMAAAVGQSCAFALARLTPDLFAVCSAPTDAVQLSRSRAGHAVRLPPLLDGRRVALH